MGGCPSNWYATVDNRPCVERTAFCPVFISRKHPVPYLRCNV